MVGKNKKVLLVSDKMKLKDLINKKKRNKRKNMS